MVDRHGISAESSQQLAPVVPAGSMVGMATSKYAGLARIYHVPE